MSGPNAEALPPDERVYCHDCGHTTRAPHDCGDDPAAPVDPDPRWLTEARAAERGEGPGGVWKLTGPGGIASLAEATGSARRLRPNQRASRVAQALTSRRSSPGAGPLAEAAASAGLDIDPGAAYTATGPRVEAGPVLGEEARLLVHSALNDAGFWGGGFDWRKASEVAVAALGHRIAALVAQARADERVRVLRDVVGHLNRNGVRGEETDYIRHLLAAAERTVAGRSS